MATVYHGRVRVLDSDVPDEILSALSGANRVLCCGVEYVSPFDTFRLHLSEHGSVIASAPELSMDDQPVFSEGLLEVGNGDDDKETQDEEASKEEDDGGADEGSPSIDQLGF